MSVSRGWQGLSEPAPIWKPCGGWKRNLPEMHQSVIRCAYTGLMETNKPIKIKTGTYQYQGVRIRKVKNSFVFGVCTYMAGTDRAHSRDGGWCSLQNAVTQIDAYINEQNYIVRQQKLYSPELVAKYNI